MLEAPDLMLQRAIAMLYLKQIIVFLRHAMTDNGTFKSKAPFAIM